MSSAKDKLSRVCLCIFTHSCLCELYLFSCAYAKINTLKWEYIIWNISCKSKSLECTFNWTLSIVWLWHADKAQGTRANVNFRYSQRKGLWHNGQTLFGTIAFIGTIVILYLLNDTSICTCISDSLRSKNSFEFDFDWKKAMDNGCPLYMLVYIHTIILPYYCRITDGPRSGCWCW